MTVKLDAWESTMSREETQALMDAADIEFAKTIIMKPFNLQ